ncbi:MAG: Uma2 family endonuclease [Chloroflexota bacterium]
MTALQKETQSNPNRFIRWMLEPLSTKELKAEIERIRNLDLPGSDGEPMENDRERIQINLGLQSIEHHWADRDDFFAGGNMFLYFSQRQAEEILSEFADSTRPRTTFRGPDMFVVLDVDGTYRRQKWMVWEEEGRYPDVIFEYLSPSTRGRDLGDKKALYEQTFTTSEYFCFDYLAPESEDSLVGWRLDANRRYQSITPNENGWLWSERLELWVGTWQGTIDKDTTTWMRFYTEDGELVLTGTEAAEARAQSVEDENERLRAEVERLRKSQT